MIVVKENESKERRATMFIDTALIANSTGFAPELAVQRAAVTLFNNVRADARTAGLLAFLTGHSNHLLALDKAAADHGASNGHYLGTRTVPLSQIRGSEAKTQDFDRSFHPLNTRTMHRWTSVARARQEGIPLPAVELIKVGDTYFVRDGHHRISVAHAFGEQFIEAEVTEW
jgi:hypothetical protein